MLLAAFLAPPQHNGYLDGTGYRALRMASWSAVGWTAAAVLMVPLSVADALGRPVSLVLSPGLLLRIVPKLADPTSWVLTAMIAAIVLIGCRTVLTWGWSVVLLGLALAGPLPVAFTGHSSAGGAHDIATDSLMVHVIAAALWVGGLAALLGAVASRSSDRASALATAVPRFSALALVCWLAMAVTGVVNALVRVPSRRLSAPPTARSCSRSCWRCWPSACSAPSTVDDRSARPPRVTRGRSCGSVPPRSC